MDGLERLRAGIPGFPGYSDGDDRRHSDGLVRSYFGEALALLRDRLEPMDAPTQERVDELIMRAGFMNQTAFRAFEYTVLDGSHVEKIAAADVALIDLADRASKIDAPGLTEYLDEADRAFVARDAAMRGAASG